MSEKPTAEEWHQSVRKVCREAFGYDAAELSVLRLVESAYERGYTAGYERGLWDRPLVP